MSNVYVANYTPKNILFYLWEHGVNAVVMKEQPNIRGAVRSHPDILMCKMGVGSDAPLIRADAAHLGYEYPNNVAYNTVCLDRYFIHNL
ncbi:MAG: hypothetical protein IJ072_07930, partial [Oscillospiraceae bacterium]|nr:hypothetical protein [Oscillospiraceae bacterium]